MIVPGPSSSSLHFTRDIGHKCPPLAWTEARRSQLRAELDAWYAVDPKELMGIDFPSEAFRVLQKYEITKYGKYRTRRFVLAAYDAQVAAGAQPRLGEYE